MLNSYKWLLFKEWKMMKGFVIGKYILVFLLLMFSYMFDEGFSLDVIVMMLMFSVIVLPAALLFNLNSESARLQLFLHNPQSIHQMLSVKIVFCTLMTACYVAIIVILLKTSELLLSLSGYEIVSNVTMTSLIYSSFFLLLTSLYPAIIALFLWTLHQIWRTYIGGISILFVVVILFLGSIFIGIFQKTDIYANLTEWGPIFSSDISYGNASLIVGSFHIGDMIYNGIIITVLYFISAYLIDRKVEV